MMSEQEVRIVRLAPMQVAMSYGFGASPEGIAWDKLLSWAKSKGLLGNAGTRFFGFNNPNPAPGSPNYGYEQWMTVAPDVAGEGDVTIKTFDGGLYAVTRCTLDGIGEAWGQLVMWREGSRYRPAHHQWLEESISPPQEMAAVGAGSAVLDIYLPIAE
jgi:DNA gyrase inhibitor GyrI